MKSKIPLNSRKMYNSSALWNSMCTKILHFCLRSILSPAFGLFPCKRTRDIRYFKCRKIQRKYWIAAPPIGRYSPISNQHQFFIKIQLKLMIRDFPYICSWDTVSTKFWRQTDQQTDKHFLKVVKSCSEHFKTCKFIENQKSKIFANSIFSSN